MKGLVRLSIVNLTLLCIGLIGGLMLVMTGIAVNKSLTQLHQAELETRIVELVDTVEKIALGVRLLEGVRQQALGGFGLRVELPKPCPILEVGDRVHVECANGLSFGDCSLS